MPGSPNLADAFRDLVSDIGLLIRQELKLVQAEASEKLGQAQNGLVALAVGAVFAVSALMVFVQALVYGLSTVMAPWLAALATGVFLASVALIALNYARSNLRPLNLAPRRTIQSLRRQTEEMKEALQ